VAFFLRKIILAEYNYETYNKELLAIIELYLEGALYLVTILIDYANLKAFIIIKQLIGR
ncbi:hypothetical protein CERZMDRAFT_34381, partial [Cercospora zeae-maydis SCOH1-5]